MRWTEEVKKNRPSLSVKKWLIMDTTMNGERNSSCLRKEKKFQISVGMTTISSGIHISHLVSNPRLRLGAIFKLS